MIIKCKNRRAALRYLAKCLPSIRYSVGYDPDTISLDEIIVTITTVTPSRNTTDNLKFYNFLVSEGVLNAFIVNVLKNTVHDFDDYSSAIVGAFIKREVDDGINWTEVGIRSYTCMITD